jgi:hypothetical protein
MGNGVLLSATAEFMLFEFWRSVNQKSTDLVCKFTVRLRIPAKELQTWKGYAYAFFLAIAIKASRR